MEFLYNDNVYMENVPENWSCSMYISSMMFTWHRNKYLKKLCNNLIK